MPSNTTIGYQISLGIWNGVSAYNNVAEITNVSPPQYSRDAVEATHQQSANGFREYIPGLLDAGEVPLEINYVPTPSDPILTAMRAGLTQFRISLPNNVTCTFSGIITAFNPDTPLDGKMSANITIKVSGMPVWA